MMSDGQPDEQQDFIKAFLSAHRSLYAYIVSLTPNLNDAEEVFQKTSLILWEKWKDFDSQRNFLPWAFGIARIQTRNHLSKNGRQEELLGDDAAKIVAEAFERSDAILEVRLEALQHCLQKLSLKQQRLLKRCYCEKSSDSLQGIAKDFNLTANAIYLQLKRLREMLHVCIDRTLQAEKQ